MTQEIGIMQSLICNVLDQMKQKNVRHVAEIRFRRCSAFSEQALIRSFDELTQGTALDGARLVIETTNLEFACKCGHKQVITCDDLLGNVFVCPECGAASEIEHTHDIEVVKVIPAPQAHVRC